MAKVLVRNTREHDIDLFATTKSGVAERVTIPAGTFDGANKAVTPGEAEVDSSFLDACEKNKAVRGMFDEGWLTVERKSAPAPAGNTGGTAGNDGGTVGNDGGKK